jgi:hypothetical protein
MFNKFYRDDFYNIDIEFVFTLKVYNIKRFEGGQYGLTFLFYLHDHFVGRQQHGEEVIDIFLKCRKADGSLLIPDADFLKKQRYSYGIRIADNPNNPMEGTKDAPLEYECIFTISNFAEPSPEVEKCMKQGCPYTNYFGICRNHEDELTAEELEDVEDSIDMHDKKLEAFTERLDAFESIYKLVGTHELPENDYREEDENTVWIITAPKN